MASIKYLLFFVLFINGVRSDSLFERSYEYVMNLGKNLGPTFNGFLDCFGERDAWSCTREMAGRLLDSWDRDVDKQRRLWAGKLKQIVIFYEFFLYIYELYK